MTNHFWLLNEGLCLLDILVLSVFINRDDRPRVVSMTKFMCIGWLLPAIFTTINVVYLHMRPSKHAVQSCWNDLSNEQFSLYIINGPIITCILLNGVIFSRLLCLMVQKSNTITTRPSVTRDWHRAMRLVRSILMLIPLLGLHFIIFVFVNVGSYLGDGADSSESLEYANIFCDVVMTSFEGFAIALLYCYLNGEVQEVIKGHICPEQPFRRDSSLSMIRRYRAIKRGSSQESTSSIATGPKEANRKDSCDTKKSIIFSQRPSIS